MLNWSVLLIFILKSYSFLQTDLSWKYLTRYYSFQSPCSPIFRLWFSYTIGPKQNYTIYCDHQFILSPFISINYFLFSIVSSTFIECFVVRTKYIFSSFTSSTDIFVMSLCSVPHFQASPHPGTSNTNIQRPQLPHALRILRSMRNTGILHRCFL